jgi:hypothetical protein
MFSACTKRDITLWTANSELTLYADIFNKSQNKYRINLIYKENPGKAILKESGRADVIIGQELNNTATAEKLKTLSKLISTNNYDNEYFYTEILQTCRVSGKYKCLPVSFSIPAVIYTEKSKFSDKSTAVELQQILSEDSKLLITAKSLEIFINEYSPEKEINIIAEKVTKEISPLYNKTSYLFEELENTTKFLQILQDRKTECFVDSFKYYFQIPQYYRNKLQYKWLTNNEKIRVLSDINYIGIPENAGNSAGAYYFIKWLLSFENQNKILFYSTQDNPESFGICKGFSAVQKTTRELYPEYYPELKDRIPYDQDLIKPEFYTENINNLYNDVTAPWIIEKLMGKNNTSLSEEINRWKRSMPVN